MTDEQILQMVKECFNEGRVQDDGSCFEWWGYNASFLKFARAIRQNGYLEGYDEGWESAKESTEMNCMEGIYD